MATDHRTPEDYESGRAWGPVVPPSPWLTIEQAAERLQVSVRTVERMVDAGRLTERRPHATSRARRYHVDDVDAAMQPTETDQ